MSVYRLTHGFRDGTGYTQYTHVVILCIATVCIFLINGKYYVAERHSVWIFLHETTAALYIGTCHVATLYAPLSTILTTAIVEFQCWADVQHAWIIILLYMHVYIQKTKPQCTSG